MVKAGEVINMEGILVKIMEVIEYKTFSGKKMLLIGYRIKDGDYESPTAHFWMDYYADIKEKIKEVVDFYLAVRKVLR